VVLLRVVVLAVIGEERRGCGCAGKELALAEEEVAWEGEVQAHCYCGSGDDRLVDVDMLGV